MRILIRNRQRHRSLDSAKIRKAANTLLLIMKQSMAELSIVFVGDKKMADLNKTYRGINRSTDVLSFEARIPVTNREAHTVLGDIIINVPRAELQARSFGTGFYDEINRLLIHGILHLLGYVHEESSHKARIMKEKEKELLHAIKEMDTEH